MNFRLFYEVHKSKFKIGISIVLAVIILTIIICSILLNPERNIRLYTRPSNTTITSSDKVFNISFNNSHNLNSVTSNNYILALENSEDFLLAVSKTSKTFNFDLKKILESDKETFLNSLSNYENPSEISNKSYTNISGVSYNLTYNYKSIDYVIIEFLTEINENLYFFDIRYPKALENKYENLANELLNSITIN